MASQSSADIAIDVASVDQFFNAPPVNPMSERTVELLGSSGLSYLVRQLQARRREWHGLRVVLRLPPDQIEPGSESRIVDAMHRYCHAKIADNALEIHLIRVRAGLGLGIIGAFVAAVIVITYLLFTGIFSGAPQAAQFAVAAAISLFAWVTLWDVLEALIFNPIPLLRENSTLRELLNLPIVVEPERTSQRLDDRRPQPDVSAMASPSV